MQIIWRQRALNDLEAIREFIAEDSPPAARRVRDAIITAISRLATHPSLGRPGRIEGTRELIISSAPYIVAYRIAEPQIRILAIIHTSRQWPRHL